MPPCFGDIVAGPLLESFVATELRRQGIVLYTGSEQVSFGPRLVAIPIHGLWTMPAKA